MNDEPDGRILRADDPRLSEWIDGRLPAAEAAAVARSVAESPELAQVVADLRRVKALLAAAPARPAPAGFVADVLAALDAPPRLAPGTAAGSGDGPADARIDAEWQRIELERIAGEIAEAREDAAVAETIAEPRRHWPWMTMLAALAAGLLVTAFVNMPPLHSVLVEKDRDVALRGAGHPQEGLSRAVDEFFADSDDDATPRLAADKVMESAEQKRQAGESETSARAPVAAAPLAAPPAEASVAAVPPAGSADGSRAGLPGEPPSNLPTADARPGSGGGGGAPGVDALETKAGQSSSDPLAKNARQSSSDLSAKGEGRGRNSERYGGKRDASLRGKPGATKPLVVVVRGAQGRAEFAALLAARNISVARGLTDSDRERLAEARQAPVGRRRTDAQEENREAGRDADTFGDAAAVNDPGFKSNKADAPLTPSRKALAASEEEVAISGSPADIGALIASLDTGRFEALKRQTTTKPRAARDETAPADVAAESGGAEDGEADEGPAEELAKDRAEDVEKNPAKNLATVTVLIRLVDIGPADPAPPAALGAGEAKAGGGQAGGAQSQAAGGEGPGEAQGAGPGQTP